MRQADTQLEGVIKESGEGSELSEPWKGSCSGTESEKHNRVCGSAASPAVQSMGSLAFVALLSMKKPGPMLSASCYGLAPHA